jgi:hypothetical protein
MMTELKSAVNMWEPRAQDSQPIEEAPVVNPIPSGLEYTSTGVTGTCHSRRGGYEWFQQELNMNAMIG